jgi:hypothetical protein
MIPVPSINYIPKLLRDVADASGTALTNKLDTHLDSLLTDVIGLGYLLSPDRCPDAALNEFGYFLNAGITSQDTSQQKRQKIYGAIKAHKSRGEWLGDVKPKIDLIVGNNAVLFRAIDAGDSIFCGDLDTQDFTAFNWMCFGGGDTTSAAFAIDFIGDGTEIEVAGNIFIDCHSTIHVSTLTAAQVQQIVNTIMDSIPVYFRINLGYTDVTGAFNIYTTINP